jgi:tetratricopeptide (TPR) repeat protein
MMTNGCCACGEEGVVNLKTCKSCMQVKYCNAICQKNHWAKHKKECKQRAAELRDEALFKDPPAKEDCPICFLPLPVKLVCCVSLPPATILSVPIYDLLIANEALADEAIDQYYPCCGKSICQGCVHSFDMSGNDGKCPFCNSERAGKTHEDGFEEMRKRVDVNDAGAMWVLAGYYSDYQGVGGLQQDHTMALKLLTKSADLGFSQAHCHLGDIYREEGNMKKAKFHYEAAAMAGHEVARCNLGILEWNSGNIERAMKHWTIAASAGNYNACII